MKKNQKFHPTIWITVIFSWIAITAWDIIPALPIIYYSPSLKLMWSILIFIPLYFSFSLLLSILIIRSNKLSNMKVGISFQKYANRIQNSKHWNGTMRILSIGGLIFSSCYFGAVITTGALKALGVNGKTLFNYSVASNLIFSVYYSLKWISITLSINYMFIN